MPKLSDTALILLGKAAEREDRLAIVPPKLPAAARNAVARSLVNAGEKMHRRAGAKLHHV
jgi:hypothetical protein